jgi:DNA polymerase-3 subunit beta
LKIEILAGDLASAAIYALAGISPRPTVPVLAGMKIVAGDGEVVLTGSDGDTIATARADANVAEPGEVVIPGKMFAEVAKGLPAKEPVQLVTEQDKLILGYGRGEYVLVAMVAGTYPDLPGPAQTIGKVPADMLAAAISRTMIAVRQDSPVVELTTLQLVVGTDSLTFNATDGHRLAQATVPLQADPALTVPQMALIPGRHPAALVKAVPGEHDVLVGLSKDRGIVTFAAPDRALTCRVIGGEKFPKVERQFAATPAATAVIDRKALREAADRVATVADKDTPVYLQVTPGEVRVSGGGGSGSGGETMWAELDGEDQKCGFKPAYLREILEAAGTQSVAFGFTGHRKPVLITDGAQGKAHDASFRFLLMPQTPQAVAEMAGKA